MTINQTDVNPKDIGGFFCERYTSLTQILSAASFNKYAKTKSKFGSPISIFKNNKLFCFLSWSEFVEKDSI